MLTALALFVPWIFGKLLALTQEALNQLVVRLRLP
jgi:flagellar biosynthesis protein FliQ